MGNLDIWNRFADIDPKFTKPITGKPYRGTSPNPHYIIRCLTEMFGPVGVGFGWEVIAEGFQPLGDEVLHWCRIRFWHGDGKGFEAYGQTKAYMRTKSGFMSDEDAPKKSLTDAITKAAAQVGVASNIFLGRWDDNRYVAEVNAEYRAAERTPPAELPADIEPNLPDFVAWCRDQHGGGAGFHEYVAKTFAALWDRKPSEGQLRNAWDKNKASLEWLERMDRKSHSDVIDAFETRMQILTNNHTRAAE